MSKSSEILKIRSSEHKDQRTRQPIFAEFRPMFVGSAFVENKEWGPREVDVARAFLLEGAKYAHPFVDGHYPEHLVIAGIYARKLAEQVGSPELDKYEAEAMGGYMHDCGRLIVPHRYLRTNLIEQILFNDLGVRMDAIKKLPSVPAILGIVTEPNIRSMNDVKIAPRILDVADNLGKRNPDGSFFTIEQMRVYVHDSTKRYTGMVWASEVMGREAQMTGRPGFNSQLVLDEISWLEELGVDFDRLRNDVAAEFFTRGHQDWIVAFKNAQECLDRRVDEKLGRPPIDKVVFDIGGVLFDDADERLFEAMAEKLRVDSGVVKQAILGSLEDGMVNKEGEEGYLKRFWQDLGLPFPGVADANAVFNCPEIYKPVEGMQDLVKKLQANPNIQVGLLSDAVLPLAPVIREAVTKYFPGIGQGQILISSEEGFAKRGEGAQAFRNMMTRWGIDGERVLFVDDREGYAFAARRGYGMRGFTFRGDPLTREGAVERLNRELVGAGLI